MRCEDDLRAVAATIGRPGLTRDEVDDAVSGWTRGLDKAEVAKRLQDAGVPAAPMNRAVDVLADPQVRTP